MTSVAITIGKLIEILSRENPDKKIWLSTSSYKGPKLLQRKIILEPYDESKEISEEAVNGLFGD